MKEAVMTGERKILTLKRKSPLGLKESNLSERR